ncbi:hypothetical protein EDB83DRAFT_2528542 [Lactarius deliciosus]|nr:hypothetical protein EDB83DRAFT_2528542 [Lactarius deliciosus]
MRARYDQRLLLPRTVRRGSQTPCTIILPPLNNNSHCGTVEHLVVFTRTKQKISPPGSIEHLQHYFTKTGLIAKKESNAQRKGLIPAIGSLSAHIKANPSLSGLPELNLPPSPALPPPTTRDPPTRLTTHAIRTVRNYLLSLPGGHRHTHDHSSQGGGASPTELSDEPTDASFSVSIMQIGGQRESILVWDEEEDGCLYKQDLKVEDIEKQRGVLARYLDTVDEVLFGGCTSDSVPLLNLDQVAPDTKMAASGRPARRVVSANVLDSIRDLVVTKESEMLVEEDGDDDDGDGDDEISSVDDDDLPRWAKRSAFPDDPLMRVHALLVALLPAFLLFHLPGSQDRAEFLNALSSGQLLCLAYNAGVRQSRKPWGYINTDSVRDIIALEAALTKSEVDGSQDEKGRKCWTFRRTDNLCLWGAAVRIRYMLPIISPTMPDVPTLKPNPTGEAVPPSTSSSKFEEPPIFFDARSRTPGRRAHMPVIY